MKRINALKIVVAGLLPGFIVMSTISHTGAQNAPQVPSATAPSVVVATLPAPPLRAWAQTRDMHIGAAVAVWPLQNNPQFAQVLAREFSILTPENAMKMEPLRPSRDTYFFDEADALVNFATANAMQVHGHTFVWHRQNPKWLTENEKQWTRDSLMQALREHIFTVAGRYKGRIKVWDVVNEAIDDGGNMRDSIWLRVIGPDYIEMAFRWAREADPHAKLLYNDYSGEDMGHKANKIYELVKDLKARGVPLDGVGLQMHFEAGKYPKVQDMAANMRRLGELGLEVHVTELDLRVNEPFTPEKLEQQARAYREILEVCLAAPNCRDFIMWGLTDRHSWVPGFFKGTGAALIFDEALQPKPAYFSLIDALRADALRAADSTAPSPEK